MFEAQRRLRNHRTHTGNGHHERQQCMDADLPCEDCPADTIPLSMAPCDECVRLVGVQGGQRLRKRLAELGLNTGSTMRVVQSHGGGPMILAVKGDTRMAIGRGMAHKILVAVDGASDMEAAR